MTDTPVMTREDIDAQHGPHAWTPEQLLARLQELEIDTDTIDHDPMWTVEDSRRLRADLSS